MILSKQVLSVVSRPARLSSHVSRLHPQLCDIGKFVDELKSAGVELFAGVPDSLLKSFCAYVMDTCVVKKATPPLLLHQWGQTL